MPRQCYAAPAAHTAGLDIIFKGPKCAVCKVCNESTLYTNNCIYVDSTDSTQQSWKVHFVTISSEIERSADGK